MERRLIFGKRQGFTRFWFFFACVALILISTGCGDESSSQAGDGQITPASSESGSASFSIQWHTAATDRSAAGALERLAITDCSTVGVASITTEVFDESNNFIASGGPWPCDAHSGRVDNISAGPNRTFAVLGWDAADGSGNLIYHGQISGITISPGAVADTGTIDAFPFTPILTLPADGVSVDASAVSLEWQPISDADEYLVQVAENNNFDPLVIDTTTPASVHAPATLLPSTTYYWKIAAIDINQNVGPESAVRSFSTTDCSYIIDPPSRSVPVGGDTYTVTVTASNASCSWTASKIDAWISLSPTGGSGDGTVNVTVAANTGAARSSQGITIAGQTHTVNQAGDGTAPTVTITSPTSNPTHSTTNSTLSIGGTASDNAGVTQVTWANSRGGSGVCSGTTTWSASGIALQSGTNVITVTAYDAAGNTGTDTLTVAYTPPDTTNPTVTITSPTSNPTHSTTNSTLSIGGTAADNVGVTQVTWANSRGGGGTCSGTTTWSASGIALQSGTNVITVTAHDAAGNTGTDTLTVTYTPPDTTNPKIAISAPTSGATYKTTSSTLSIGGTASDNVGVTQVTWANSRGGNGVCSGTTTWSAGGIALLSGDNVITVTAYDAAGNTGTDTLTVNYTPPDTTNPTVTITSPTSASTYSTTSGTLSIGGTASDNVGVTQVTWANSRGGSGVCSGTTTWSASGIALFVGTNVITVTARDAAGNTGTDTLTVTYSLPDLTSPTVTITSPTSGSTYNTNSNSLNIGGTASDNVGVTQVTWSNDRGGSGVCTGTTAWSASGIALSDGANVITVTARDAAGNTGIDRLTVNYTPPDQTAPVVTITIPTSSSTYTTTNASLSIGGTASDNVGVTQVTWSNDRGGSGVCSGITAWDAGGIKLASGVNIITVTAYDAAGNTGTDTLQVTLVASPSPPVISSIGHTYTGIFDGCINSSGGTFTGYTYDIDFNYTDVNGDITAADGAYATAGNFNFYLSGSLVTQNGDGFQGTLTLFYCTSSANASVTVTLTDGAGLTSNSLSDTLTPN